MKTNSLKHQKTKGIIERQLKRIPINKLSKQSGFCKRKPRKIFAKKLVIAFLLTIWNCKTNTYSNWASKLGLLINDTVSRQAIAKRVSKELVIFLKKVLEALMCKSLEKPSEYNRPEKLKEFKRILVEDSTNIHLSEKFNKDYPGSRNQSKKEYATLKIQAVYELLKKRFIRFEITSFRKNDQGYAPKILSIVKPGDMVIRDLGYFVLDVFKKFIAKKVNFVSLLRKGIRIYKDEEEPIDLAEMLKKRGNLDIEVFLGEKDRVPVRLIAIPVEQEVAAARRRRAKVKRDRRYNLTQKHLFLLGWNLYITSLSGEKFSSTEIARLYAMRWRIETIFKCWKSTMGITKVPKDSNKIRLEAFIYCMLIFIMIFQVNYYNYYSRRIDIKRIDNNQISLIKFMRFVVNNISEIIYQSYLETISIGTLLKKHVSYYCLYEYRANRTNFNQLVRSLS